MIPRILVFSAFVTVSLAGCSPQALPTPTPSSAAPTSLSPSVSTPTPASTPTSAPPTATATATSASCTNAAAFVADVTVPDYSNFNPREVFLKTWRVKNTGTCTWSADYKAVYNHGDALGAPASIPLSQTAPDQTLDISITMSAPVTAGKYQIFYRLEDQAGDPMPIDAGDSLWALITVGNVAFLPPPSPTAGPTPSGSTGLGTLSCVYNANQLFVGQVLSLINAARAANSLPALTADDQLQAAAQFHSEDMACNNYLAHTGWDGSTPDTRIAAAGYSASLTRENIYAQPPQYGGTPQSAMDWWMNDPIHQAAILNPDVTAVGIGYAYYSRSTLGGYFTVDFAKP